MMYSFLLIGQSNAAGIGYIDQAPPIDNCSGNFKVLRNGKWIKAFRPVNIDRAYSGTCFAESFAKEFLTANPDDQIGIIPCAVGDTKLAEWMPGEIYFDNALNCAKIAMRISKLTGVLWHQGEGDCVYERYSSYAKRLITMIDTLRKELNLPHIPVLMGGLGDFLSECTTSENAKNYFYVNEQLQKAANECPYCKFVPATGLGANPDNIHFNAEALDEFGKRYFKAFDEMNISL